MIFVRKTYVSETPTNIEILKDRISISYGQNTVSVSLAELLARSDFDDFTQYTFAGLNPDSVADGRNPDARIFSFFPMTAGGKGSSVPLLAKQMGVTFYAHIYIPHKQVKSLEECNVMINTTSNVKANVEYLEVDAARTDWGIPYYRMKMTGPDKLLSGQAGTYELQLLDYDGKSAAQPALIYLETTAGFLPMQRVQLDETGHGTFAIQADSVPPGQVIKLKAGFKYYSGLVEAKVSVV